jgi:hypothetical protein
MSPNLKPFPIYTEINGKWIACVPEDIPNTYSVFETTEID